MDDGDQDALDELFASASSLIESAVNRALERGRSLAEMALFVERSASGAVHVECASRLAISRRVASDARLDDDASVAIVEAVFAAGPSAIPAVFVVSRSGSGVVFGGVRTVRGEVDRLH